MLTAEIPYTSAARSRLQPALTTARPRAQIFNDRFHSHTYHLPSILKMAVNPRREENRLIWRPPSGCCHTARKLSEGCSRSVRSANTNAAFANPVREVDELTPGFHLDTVGVFQVEFTPASGTIREYSFTLPLMKFQRAFKLGFPQVFSVIIGALLCLPTLRAKDAIDYVDPFIGTGHMGKDFPGATVPFSMVKLSPDCGGGISYRYNSTFIHGFSFTHLGGADGGELGNVLVTPTTGPLQTYWGQGKPGTGYGSVYSKSTEQASAGYYAVTLDDYKVRSEMTVAPHSGILRFTFPENAPSRIQIDLARRNGGTSFHQTCKVVNDHTIEGQVDYTKAGGGWGCTYTAYYHLEFSRPFARSGMWSAALPPGWNAPSFKITRAENTSSSDFVQACKSAEVIPDCQEKEGQHLGFYGEFATRPGETVLVKAGISFVSIAGAKANLAAEIPDWNFDQIHRQARDAWSQELGRLAVEGGTEDHKTIYYSALYRALQFPQIDQDVDGNYPGGDFKPHHADGFTNRTIFSGWDVYRSGVPAADPDRSHRGQRPDQQHAESGRNQRHPLL